MFSTKMNRLENWFCPTKQLFNIFKSNVISARNIRKHRIFFNKNSKILLLAHADTVHPPKIKRIKHNKIWAAGLDDRLGCWVAYTLSSLLKTDLLITDLEESAQSTGIYHQLKKYNWIAEFDRGGEDVVLYDVGSKKLKNALAEFFTIGWGTFSDISTLNTKTACCNVGIGYQYDHSEDSFADLTITKKQMNKFVDFYYKYKDTSFKKDYTYHGCGEYNSVYRGISYKYNIYKGKLQKCEVCQYYDDNLKKIRLKENDEILKACPGCIVIFKDEIAEIYEETYATSKNKTLYIECEYCYRTNKIKSNELGFKYLCYNCGMPMPEIDIDEYYKLENDDELVIDDIEPGC